MSKLLFVGVLFVEASPKDSRIWIFVGWRQAGPPKIVDFENGEADYRPIYDPGLFIAVASPTSRFNMHRRTSCVESKSG
jgi:hypothetical protein